VDSPVHIRAQSVSSELVWRENIIEAWREATSPVYEGEPLRLADRFKGSILAYNLDGLVVSRIRFPASTFRRSASKLPDDDSDRITIQHYLAGSIRGQVGDHELYMAPDRICVQDFGVAYSGRAETSEVLGVAIPRDRIVSADRLRSRRPMFSLPLNTARGSMLAGALRVLWDELRAGRVREPATVADAFVGLVNGFVDHNVDAPTDERALHAMEEYVLAHLSDIKLGAGQLERVFHYSRSTVYRIFQPHGGVNAFIRSERLRRCHTELIRPRATPVAVSSVASRYGFHDPSQFSRAFRRTYGIAPSELAALAAGDQDPRSANQGSADTTARTIRSWLGAA
jgi:AraC-like DNA-binding protein